MLFFVAFFFNQKENLTSLQKQNSFFNLSKCEVKSLMIMFYVCMWFFKETEIQYVELTLYCNAKNFILQFLRVHCIHKSLMYSSLHVYNIRSLQVPIFTDYKNPFSDFRQFFTKQE